MKSKHSFIIALLSVLLFLGYTQVFSAFEIPGAETIRGPSIKVGNTGGDLISSSKALGWQILDVAKIVVSGFALFWIVFIGVNMVVFSDNEETIKKQRMQIMYALIGFMFINIPGILYTVFNPPEIANTTTITRQPWTLVGRTQLPFLNNSLAEEFLTSIIDFFKVFIFGVAIVLLTWSAFEMMTSGGNEEKYKKARGRLIYSILGIIFVGFVQTWGWMMADGALFNTGSMFMNTGKKLFGVALYFAGPIAIFFLMWGSYYYITSGGDEERAKRGKNIIKNTFLATIILLAAFTFLNDLIGFTL